MMEKILLYEELSLNALPALQTQFYDGWVLRFTSGYGYTNRANSVNILYPSAIDINTKLAECEKRYFAQGLPAVFKITDGVNEGFDKFLENKGYTVASPTYLMTSNMALIQNKPCECVLLDYIDDEWLDAYFSLSKYVDEQKISIARQVFANIKVPVICGRVTKNGATAACGLCVIERGYAGLFNIVVDEPQRGKGYGKEICGSLLSAAKGIGAHTSYLQVMQDNHTALGLYAKFGYQTIYSYWYRVKKREEKKP